MYSVEAVFTVYCAPIVKRNMNTRVSDCLPRDVIVYYGCEKSTWYLCQAKHNIGYPWCRAYDNILIYSSSMTFCKIIKISTC